jgi:exopolysaccharide biosynthesis protein
MINLQDDDGNLLEKVYVLRLEPGHFRFGVAYHPAPQDLEGWRKETGALIVLNGGYFRQDNGTFIPNGLTVVDGEVIGRSFGSFAGMFVVTRDGPELRWLTHKPYDPNEQLIAALQSFPMLVRPGGELGFPEEYEDNQRARRTVIGQDRNGRLLFIVARIGTFTLHQLSVYLIESNFDLDIAINLDGGPSSGVLLAEPYEEVSALIPLPIVITVHAH